MPLFIRRRGSLLVGGSPSLALLSNATLAATTNAYVNSNVSLGIPARDRVIILSIPARSGQISRAIVNGVELIPRILAGAAAQNAFVSIWSGIVPDDAIGVFNIVGATGSAPVMSIYRATGISPVPVDAQSSATAAATARSVDLRTMPGGFIIACACNNVGAANQCTWTGDQSPTEDSDAAVGSSRGSSSSTQSANDDAANTITATFDVIATTQIALAAASFR